MAISFGEQEDKIVADCRQYRTERLFVFGSAIRESSSLENAALAHLPNLIPLRTKYVLSMS
jgi:hypothetical protein